MPRIRTLVLILAGGAGGRLELLAQPRQARRPVRRHAPADRLPALELLQRRVERRLGRAAVPARVAERPPRQRAAVGPRPHDRRAAPAGAAPRRRAVGFPGRHRRGAVEQPELIREFAPEALVVLSADAIYKLDYGALVEEHCEAGTRSRWSRPRSSEPERYGVVQVSGGRDPDYAYKPDEPGEPPDQQRGLRLRARGRAQRAGRVEGRARGSRRPAPARLVDAGEVREHRFEGYWRDVGTIGLLGVSSGAAHRGAADRPRRPGLADPHARDREPRVGTGARRLIEASLIAPGARSPAECAERDRAWRGGRGGGRPSSIDPVPGCGRARRSAGRAGDSRRRRGGRGGVRVGEAGGEIALVGLQAVVESTVPGGARATLTWRGHERRRRIAVHVRQLVRARARRAVRAVARRRRRPRRGCSCSTRRWPRELGLDPSRAARRTAWRCSPATACPTAPTPIAQAYAGHQFGGYSPRLGDGRALLLGEVIDAHGRRRDLHLKGSGRTPFARGGDGKAAVGPMLREYVIGEAMHALGIPTTPSARGRRHRRAGRPRDGCCRARCSRRVAASHIRVGTFEYAAAHGDAALAAAAGRLRDRPPLPGRGRRREPVPGVLRARRRRPGRAGRPLDARRVHPRRDEHRQHGDLRRDDRLRPVRVHGRLRPGHGVQLDRPRRPLRLRQPAGDRAVEPGPLRRDPAAAARRRREHGGRGGDRRC